jgi:hypothetical protein
MLMSQEFEDMSPVSCHAYYLLHRLDVQTKSARFLCEAMRIAMTKAMHRPSIYQQPTSDTWREHRLRFWWALYAEERLHAVVYRQAPCTAIVDDIPLPLNVSQRIIDGLTAPYVGPQSAANDGTALVVRAKLALVFDGILVDQQRALPADPVELSRALYHARRLAELRDALPLSFRLSGGATCDAMGVQRVQLAATIAGIQLKLLLPQVVASMAREDRSPDDEAVQLAREAAYELVAVHRDLRDRVTGHLVASSSALAYLLSLICACRRAVLDFRY